MKKFLFTLATLLMAGSMFAGENYFYLDNITLTKDEAAAGCKKVVNVKGHFDEAVSAWQVKFTLPEGVTIDVATAGSDMTLTYQNQLTDSVTLDPYYAEATYTPNLSPNADKTNFIVSVMDTKEYDPSTGKSYGICWRPGDYNQMWRVRLVFPAGFKGGDIVLNTQQSCSQSIMPGLTGCTLNPIDKTTEVRIKADKPEIAVTGDDYTKTVTITAEEGATIYYSTNGVDYQVYSAPIVFNKEGTYKVYAYAEGPGEGVERKSKSDVAESDEFTIIAQEQPAPEPKITMSGNYVVTAAVEDDDPDAPHTVKLYLVEGENRTEVANPYPITQTYDDQSYTFVAVTIANDGESDDTECDPVTFNVPGKEKDYAPTPTITKIENGTKVEATVEGNYEVVLMLEGEDGVYAPCANPYTLPAQTYEEQTLNFKAYTKKNGEYYDSHETEVFTVTIPALDKDYAPIPTISKTEDGTKVQATVNEDGYEVVLMLQGENGEYAPCDNPYTLPENDSYTNDIVLNFKAYTKKKGEYYDSPETEVFTVTIPKLNKNTAQKPTIVRDDANMTKTTCPIVITADPNTDGTLEYTAPATGTGGAKAAQTQTLYYERKDADYTVHVEAWTTEGDTYLASEVAKADIVIPAKPAPEVYNVPDPTITVDNSDPTKTVITIEATEGVLSYTLTEDGKPFTDYTVEVVDGKTVITIANGKEVKTVDVTATTTLTSVPEGYDSVENGYAEQTVQTPVYVQPQTAAPTIDVSFDGEAPNIYANVTFKNNQADPNAVIEYSLDGENWFVYDPAQPVVIRTDGTTRVYARATADGKATSEEVYRDVNLNQTATSVNELVNGKTVAGVRYFNMAGQEMQEANGITIVVTTYTDGTTSAVKVIK